MTVALLAAAAALPAVASADEPAPPTTNSGTSGGRTGDFTGDGVYDILARGAVTGIEGQLRVYQHSGLYQGTATYRAPVTINHGWQNMRWIGQARVGSTTGQPDALSDVVAIDSSGAMWVYPHSGTYDGTNTITSRVLVGAQWGINDLIFPYDWNSDGFDDIIARRKATGTLYVYLNNGGLSGTSTFRAPVPLNAAPGAGEIELNLADFSGDGVPELLRVFADGAVFLTSFVDGRTYKLGFNWDRVDSITLTDVNRDGRPDILGRTKADGRLWSYTHTGRWEPDGASQVYSTLNPPVLIGYNWWANDVIS